jgi:XTP/dITP diphosphohydrolase
VKKIIIASHNPGKLREIARILEPLGLEAVPQADFGVPEAEEPHVTFIENCLAKARHASAHTGLPALADDSGICVDALNGAPGVYSARYAGDPRSDARNNQKLIESLRGEKSRTAHYYCVMVFLRYPDDPQPIIAEGVWRGEIIEKPRGTGGFGYDPHFLVPELNKTGAELSMDIKNQLSHRGQAMRALAEKLRADFGRPEASNEE